MYRKTLKYIKLNLPVPHFILTVLCLAVISAGCEKTAEQHQYSIFAFGTLIDVSLYDVDKNTAQTAFEMLQKDFDRYHLEWSPWTNGDLAQLNASLENNSTVPVPEHLLPLIEKSIDLSRQSNNYYNPTIGKLINLWQFHKSDDENIRPPDANDIAAIIKNGPQMSDISLDKQNRLLNRNPAVSFNFGAFAKGYAIEAEIRRLQEMGIKNAVINAGGDLSVIGQHGNRAWNIGIRHPRNDSILASIEVKNNESVFTSGDYERFYYFQGRRYHHILDPATGYPADGAQSVTVLHHDAGIADAAATAIFVAGRENWRNIAKSMNIQYVMLIDENGDIHLTPKLKKRIKFLNKSPASHIIVSEEL